MVDEVNRFTWKYDATLDERLLATTTDKSPAMKSKFSHSKRFWVLRVTFIAASVSLMSYTFMYLWASDKMTVTLIPGKVRSSYIVPMMQRIAEQISDFASSDDAEEVAENLEDGDDISQATDKVSECSIFSPWNKNLIDPKTSTNLQDWGYRKRVKCKNITLDKLPKLRRKIILDCKSSPPTLKYVWTNSSRDLFSVPWGDTCLEKVIDNCCTDKMAVPNVLHYIWYKEVEFGYFHFLSYMSALRFMKPCLYLIHGNYVPYGKYWDYFISISPNVIHVKRDRLLSIHGHNFSFHEHSGDVMRIEAIQKYGGLYLDWDQILLRSIDNLRQYNCTMGQVFKTTFGNQVIFGRKNATFLKLWHDSYKDYKTKNWGHNSLVRPFQIAKANPSVIHIEGYNFTRPHGGQVGMIFHRNYDWSTNYAIHLYIRYFKKKIDLNSLRTLNTTMGAVSRHVFLGNKELCEQ